MPDYYELISEWGSNKIYRDGDRAIKIYSSDTSCEYIAETARVQTLLYDAGLPVPAVYGVRRINEGETALDTDYIQSKPFVYENMSVEERDKAVKMMAKLQCEINAVDASGFNLPRFSQHIADEIKRTSYLTDRIKEKAFEMLYHLDKGKNKLCHGDIHLHNILFDGEKHWVIDWDSASVGDPAADACMAYFYEKRTAQHYGDTFLHSYCTHSKLSQDEILAWLPVIAAFQVNIETKDEREFILNVIHKCYENM